MYNKEIKYVDFDGNERTETFQFHLSKAELAEMELSKVGGFKNYIQAIIDADDREQLLTLFKGLILKSYGRKSEDGKRFVKSEEISRAFEECPAYSELFIELVTNTDAAISFVNGIIPPELQKKVEESSKQLEG